MVEVTLPSPKSNVSNILSLTSPNVIVSHGQRKIGLFENLLGSNICNFGFYYGKIQLKVKVAYNTFVPENDPLIRALNRCPTPQLGTDLESLLSSGHSADVWIKVGSEEIPAHKLILCARVPYFRKMFDSGMKEAVNNKVEIPDTDPALFKQLLKFIYTGKVEPNLKDSAFALLQLADFYDIQDLKNICEAALVKSDNGDLISSLITTHIYDCPELKQKYIDELIQACKGMKQKRQKQLLIDSLKSFPDLLAEVFMGLMEIQQDA